MIITSTSHMIVLILQAEANMIIDRSSSVSPGGCCVFVDTPMTKRRVGASFIKNVTIERRLFKMCLLLPFPIRSMDIDVSVVPPPPPPIYQFIIHVSVDQWIAVRINKKKIERGPMAKRVPLQLLCPLARPTQRSQARSKSIINTRSNTTGSAKPPTRCR